MTQRVVLALALLTSFVAFAKTPSRAKPAVRAKAPAKPITLNEEAPTATAATFAPFTAGKILIEGNRRIEKDAILEKMKLKPGTEVTPAGVRADLLAIFAMGYFEDLKVEKKGGDVLVSVKERPVVTEIEYEGNEEFEKKDLDEAAALKAFTVVNPAKIRLAQTAISKKYEEKGYYLARADYVLNPVEGRPGEVKLLFKISENEKVRIRKVHFLGNANFTAGDLKQVMVTAEGHVFSWATSGGTYREGAFERDLAVLAFYYANEGYIEAKFAKPRVTLSQDRRYVDILIEVDEGKQFFLGNVTFKGDLLFSDEELRKSFAMQEKDVFSAGKLQEEILKLTDKYGDEGYAFANVIPRTTTREGTEIVDLQIDVERGEKVYWGKILVSGNTKTHDKVVRRELPFVEGELYNATKRKKGLDRVRRLGFFGNDVNFLTSTPKGSTNILDLEIRVAEKPTGSLNVAAGYGAGGPGFTLQSQVAQSNLFGKGQQLSFNLQYANNGSKTFTFQLTDPHIFDSEWLAGIDIYYQDNPIGYNPQLYRQFLEGTNLRFGREVWENTYLNATYKIQHSRLVDVITPAIFSTKDDANSIISSIETSGSYDTRNNRLDPSGGEYFTLSSEFAGLGGRVFQKYLTALRVYRRLFWKLTWRSNVEYGLLANGMNSDPVPDAERFILGGIFSLRGYPFSSIGSPRQVVPERDTWVNDPTHHAGGAVKDANGNFINDVKPISVPLGGTQKFVINQEIEFPLIPDADIRAALFMDAGNSWEGVISKSSPVLYSNWGWGIRWYSPLGPLRFEWGYPFNNIPNKVGKGVEFQFVIAPTF